MALDVRAHLLSVASQAREAASRLGVLERMVIAQVLRLYQLSLTTEEPLTLARILAESMRAMRGLGLLGRGGLLHQRDGRRIPTTPAPGEDSEQSDEQSRATDETEEGQEAQEVEA